MSSETALYRHFCESGELLYVGISNSVVRRLAQHARDSKWGRRIARVEVEYHESREAAESAERAAIKAERPLWNVLHNSPEANTPERSRQPKPPGIEEVVAEQIRDAAAAFVDLRYALGGRLVAATPVSERETRFFFSAPLPGAVLCRVSALMDMRGIPGIGFHFLTGVNAGESRSGEGFLTLSSPFALEEMCQSADAWVGAPIPGPVVSAKAEYATAFRELAAACPDQLQQLQTAAI